MFERFFDESGGMQLVIHSPYGSRINRAWGLALRKRFCRTFNFELQAAATEDNIVLSLTTATASSWRTWRAISIPLASGRSSSRRCWMPRCSSDPLALGCGRFAGIAAFPRRARRCRRSCRAWRPRTCSRRSFPIRSPAPRTWSASARCPTIHWSARPSMIVCPKRWTSMALSAFSRDLEPAPSGDRARSYRAVAARPRGVVGPALRLSRRRATRRAPDSGSHGRRWLAPEDAADIGRLDPEAIARVRAEVWPDAANADELHDALVWLGFATAEEARRSRAGASGWPELASERRVAEAARVLRGSVWITAECLPHFPPSGRKRDRPADRGGRLLRRPGATSPDAALVEILRGRLEGLGPVTAERARRAAGPRARRDRSSRWPRSRSKASPCAALCARCGRRGSGASADCSRVSTVTR